MFSIHWFESKMAQNLKINKCMEEKKYLAIRKFYDFFFLLHFKCLIKFYSQF